MLHKYGKTLLDLDRFPEAEGTLREAQGILEAALGEEHERTIAVIRSLIDLYDAWHVAEPGKGYDEEAAAWRAKLEALRDQGIEGSRDQERNGGTPSASGQAPARGDEGG